MAKNKYRANPFSKDALHNGIFPERAAAEAKIKIVIPSKKKPTAGKDINGVFERSRKYASLLLKLLPRLDS
jgi:hypothetical protein